MSKLYNLICPVKARELLSEGKTNLIDVRTLQEFSVKRVANAVNIPLDELIYKTRDNLPKGKLLFICGHGNRSKLAANYCAVLGVDEKNLYSVEGGMEQWEVEDKQTFDKNFTSKTITNKDTKVLTVGSVAYDSIETPSGVRARQLGGSATYFSLAASYFAKTAIVGVVGDDFDQADRQKFIKKDIDLSSLSTIKGGKTFYWKGSYLNDLNAAETIQTNLNVFEQFKPTLSEQLRNVPCIFLANIDPELHHLVISQLSGGQKYIACDTMNLWLNTKKRRVIELFEHIDMLTINESEAYLLTGQKNLVNIATEVKKMGLKSLCVKRAEYGVALFSDNLVFIVPAYPLANIVDPTGAGDSFAGGFMGYLAMVDEISEDTLKEAVVVGNIMASFTVEEFGVQRLLNLTQKEIVDRLNGLFSLTSFSPDLSRKVIENLKVNH